MFEQLSKQLSRPRKIAFARIDVDEQKELASVYGISAYVNQDALDSVSPIFRKLLMLLVKCLRRCAC